MRDTMKRKEQLLPENLRYQRTWRAGGHVTENEGLAEGNRVNKEGRTREHRLNRRTGCLESWQGGEIKTKGGEVEVEVDGGENSLRRRIENGAGDWVAGSGKGVSYSIFYTRNMNNITGKLRDIS